MTPNLRLLFAIGVMTAIASLAGCANTIRYPTYYVLSVPAPMPAATVPTPALGPLAVRRFEAPRFLKDGPIVYRPSPEQLGFYEYHRWAVDPRGAVTDAVIQKVRSRGIFRSVDLFEGRTSPEFLLTGALDHLEEVDQGTSVSIEVGLSARLINVRTGELLWEDASSRKVRVDQRTVPAIVNGISNELAGAIDGLVSSMLDRVATASLSSRRSGEQQGSNGLER